MTKYFSITFLSIPRMLITFALTWLTTGCSTLFGPPEPYIKLRYVKEPDAYPCTAEKRTPSTVFLATGRLSDDCGLFEPSEYFPKRVILDEKVSSLTIGISNYRSDGPPFAPGHAISAKLMQTLLSKTTTLNNTSSMHLTSIPRRDDPTGLIEAADKMLEKASALKSNDFFYSYPGMKFSYEQSKEAIRKRITKRLIESSVNEHIDKIREDRDTKLVVFYISTYRIVDSGKKLLLWASDSDANRLETFVQFDQIIARYKSLAAERRDLHVLLIADTVDPRGSIKKGSFISNNDLPSNLLVVDARWSGLYPFRWAEPHRGVISQVQVLPESNEEILLSKKDIPINSDSQSRMSPLPLSLAATLRWCEGHDIDSDDVPSLELKQWILLAKALSTDMALKLPEQPRLLNGKRVARSVIPKFYCPTL